MRRYARYHQYSIETSRLLFHMAIILLCIPLIAVPLGGSADSGAPTPAVVMMTSSDEAVDDDELFLAIRAQLSGTPVLLDRYRADIAEESEMDNRQLAASVVDEAGASMVFWIEDGDVARTSYYIPGSDGGRIIERTLHLEASTRSSRIEVIAVAVASMVEKLLVTHQIAPLPDPAKTPPLIEQHHQEVSKNG